MPEQPEQEKKPGFEAGLDQLEQVVKELERGDLPLERALELFEKGMALSESCRKQLEEAETRVEILTAKGDRVQPRPYSPGK
jgi:exodeoxyribonuclease VII small subunit